MKTRSFPPGILPLTSFVAGIFACFVLSGCAESLSGTGSGTAAEPESAIDLNSEWGGVTTADEQPGFGDPDFERVVAGEVPVVEALEDEADVRGLEENPARVATYLRVVWGNLARSDEAENDVAHPGLLWDGSLSTSSGAMRLRALFRFERGDSIVRPRPNRQTVAFKTETFGGVDGIIVKLVYYPDSTDAADVLTFDTNQLTVSFPLTETADLDTIIPIDDRGNGVAITAVTDRPDCPSGVVRGMWRRGENGGVFRAVWATPNGAQVALMRGRFGTNDEGQHVFFGKVINPDGRFRALVKGRYGVDDSGQMGHWAGVVFGDDRHPLGTVGGHWAARDDGRSGLMHGRWQAFCGGDRAAID